MVNDMVTLDPVSLHDHLDLITNWLRAPHVARWWGDPDDARRQVLATPPDKHAIIAVDGDPVGYVRWAEVERAVLDGIGLTEVPDGSIDIDIFLGEPKGMGRGIGPRALRILVERLQNTTAAPFAGLCSSVDNHRAHAAFQKCGFTREAYFVDPKLGPMDVFVRRLIPRFLHSTHPSSPRGGLIR